MNAIKGRKKVVPLHGQGAKLALASDLAIEMIRKRAYELFLPHGADLADWFEAEQDLRTAYQR